MASSGTLLLIAVIGLFVGGYIYLNYIASSGSTGTTGYTGYVTNYIYTQSQLQPSNNIHTSSPAITSSGSQPLYAYVIYEQGQQGEISQTDQVLINIGFNVLNYSYQSSTGQEIYNNALQEDGISNAKLPVVVIGQFVFSSYTGYIDYRVCPYGSENFNIDNYTVTLCKSSYDQTFLLTENSLKQLYNACVATHASVCYG